MSPQDQETAWLATLINERRDAIELSEAIYQARLQAERDQEQQRLQDLLQRMMHGLSAPVDPADPIVNDAATSLT